MNRQHRPRYRLAVGMKGTTCGASVTGSRLEGVRVVEIECRCRLHWGHDGPHQTITPDRKVYLFP